MLSQAVPAQKLFHQTLTPELLAQVTAEVLNQAVSRSGATLFFFDLPSPATDGHVMTGIKHMHALQAPGMLVLGGGGLPLFFSLACWEMLDGFQDEQGEKIFTNFLMRARKLRRFPVIQIG